MVDFLTLKLSSLKKKCDIFKLHSNSNEKKYGWDNWKHLLKWMSQTLAEPRNRYRGSGQGPEALSLKEGAGRGGGRGGYSRRKGGGYQQVPSRSLANSYPPFPSHSPSHHLAPRWVHCHLIDASGMLISIWRYLYKIVSALGCPMPLPHPSWIFYGLITCQAPPPKGHRARAECGNCTGGFCAWA